MTNLTITTGYFKNGLPYTRMGSRPRVLIVFDGLDFAHKPPSGLMLRFASGYLKPLSSDYTVYLVGRKPGLPTGYSLRDMSNDYATMIKDELGGSVDVMGISTGGVIAQYFAADHPELVRRLVLAMTGYRLSDKGKLLMRQIADLVREDKWRAAAALLASAMYTGISGFMYKSLFWLFGKTILGSPVTPSDGLVEIEAEDSHNFKERLAEIRMPTLVIGGDKDFFYPIRETAEGIPDAKLVLYKGVGHIAYMKREFGGDVLAFLTGEKIQESLHLKND
jgi:pimeloyl-ACP methyl ester carboxylesterase